MFQIYKFGLATNVGLVYLTRKWGKEVNINQKLNDDINGIKNRHEKSTDNFAT